MKKKLVTPSPKTKTHFVIVDAVGVTLTKDSITTLDKKTTVQLQDLAMGVMMGMMKKLFLH